MTTTQADQYRRGDDRRRGDEGAGEPGADVSPPVPGADPAADASPAAVAAVGDDGGNGGVLVARAVLSFVFGLAGLIVAFANLDKLMQWSAEYGQVWVFLGFFLAVSVCGRLFWWGVDTIVKTAVSGKGNGR